MTASRGFPRFARGGEAGCGDLLGEAGGGSGGFQRLTARDFGVPVTDHHTSWVRRVRSASAEWYVKTYDYPGAGARWRGALRNTGPWTRSRPAREFDALAWLRENGFGGPRPVAALEWRAVLLRRAALVTEAWPGEPLDRLLARLDPSAGAALAAALGRFVGALHRAGFRDGNLDLRNLLAANGDGGWQLAKIDSPRWRCVGAGPPRDRAAAADWRRLLPQLRPFGLEHAVRAAASS